jgi:hypothetical protein
MYMIFYLENLDTYSIVKNTSSSPAKAIFEEHELPEVLYKSWIEKCVDDASATTDPINYLFAKAPRPGARGKPKTAKPTNPKPAPSKPKTAKPTKPKPAPSKPKPATKPVIKPAHVPSPDSSDVTDYSYDSPVSPPKPKPKPTKPVHVPSPSGSSDVTDYSYESPVSPPKPPLRKLDLKKIKTLRTKMKPIRPASPPAPAPKVFTLKHKLKPVKPKPIKKPVKPLSPTISSSSLESYETPSDTPPSAEDVDDLAGVMDKLTL